MNDKVRLSSIWRNQWATVSDAYNTLWASVEVQPFLSRNGNCGVGLGVSYTSDLAGELSYGERDFAASVSCFFSLNKENNAFLSVGVGLGRKSWSYEMGAMRLNREGTYDDNVAYDELHTLDLSAGVGLRYQDREERQLEVGLSVFNINQSKLSYFASTQTTQKIDRRFCASASYYFSCSDLMGLRPKAVFNSQRKYREAIYGADLVFKLQDGVFVSSLLSLGLMLRNTEALIICPKYRYNSFSAGISYDINISGLSKVSHTYGAMELWLSYSFSLNKIEYKNNKIPCPIF